MEINRTAIKYNAKAAMSAAKPRNALLVSLLFYILAYLLNYLSISLNPYYDIIYSGYMTPENFPAMAAQAFANFTIVHALVIFALAIVSSILSAGFRIYCLGISRYHPSEIGTIFDGFGIFFRFMALSIVQGFFIFLWSLLFYIPGIIAALRYSQAFYIMIDHPEYSIMECIRESKRLMDGRKGEYFVLSLSFFGWILLGVIPFVGIWVTPYMEVTMCNYYNALLELDWKSRNPDFPASPPEEPGFHF